MRILSADGSSAGDSIADVLAAVDPAIAAVSSISPADACTIATRLTLRYAVQCWDVPRAGKAIFWKPGIGLQGLYRTEFQPHNGDPSAAPYGLLRVTLLWDGRPLHVLCAELGPTREEAGWQLVQIARELQDAQGPAILALASEQTPAPVWPGFSDAWSTARWRSIVYPQPFDVDDAARAAFGVTKADPAFDAAEWLDGGPVRLFCSDHFSVVRACHRPLPGLLTRRGPLVVDFARRANEAADEIVALPPSAPAGRVASRAG